MAKTQTTAPTRKGMGAQRVYEGLRERILSLELAPGQELDEAEMVRHYEVSRTPVREAFIRLTSERLVVILPNRGARVAPLSLASVKQFFEALSLVQRAVTRWAALRCPPARLAAIRAHMAAFEAAGTGADSRLLEAANRDFHLDLAASAENAFLEKAYRELLDEGMRLSRLALLYDPPAERSRAEHLSAIVLEHREMLAAVEARDPDRAEALAAAHCELFRRRIVEYLEGSRAEAVVIDYPASTERRSSVGVRPKALR